jgi:hypothetical protein
VIEPAHAVRALSQVGVGVVLGVVAAPAAAWDVVEEEPVPVATVSARNADI